MMIPLEEMTRLRSEQPEPFDPTGIRSLPTESAADFLGGEHLTTFKRAIENVLATDIAEDTYAQIVDGLPTIDCFREFSVRMPSHPVFELNHTVLCDGVVASVRAFRAAFDPGQIRFRLQPLEAFKKADVGSHEFDLRLVELVAVACHAIAVHLYQLDMGPHKHKLHQDWYAAESQAEVLTGKHRFAMSLPCVPYCHPIYTFVDRYPDGEADVVGYWAESRILGGVVVFDRGESDLECKAVYFHGGSMGSPQTIYPPTDEQFKALMTFLKTPSPGGDAGGDGPLPILATKLNRFRWDPYYAMKDYHIFRDRYERHPFEIGKSNWRWGVKDWPEIDDDWTIMWDIMERHEGKPGDPEAAKAARERLMTTITPSSPKWKSWGNKSSAAATAKGVQSGERIGLEDRKDHRT